MKTFIGDIEVREEQIEINNKYSSSIRINPIFYNRLIGGIFRIIIFLVACFYLHERVINYINYDCKDYKTLLSILNWFGSIYMFYLFGKGIYMLMTAESGPLPMFNNSSDKYNTDAGERELRSLKEITETDYSSIKFGEKSSCKNIDEKSEYSTIERVLNYRNSKMFWLTDGDAADEYKKTAWVDSYKSSDNSNVKRALSSLNAKLYFMDNEKAYEFLKNK